MMRFIYIRTNDNHPVAVLAVKRSAVYDHRFLIGAAFCSPKDQFNKEEGRNLAMDRLAVSQRTLDTLQLRYMIDALWEVVTEDTIFDDGLSKAGHRRLRLEYEEHIRYSLRLDRLRHYYAA